MCSNVGGKKKCQLDASSHVYMVQNPLTSVMHYKTLQQSAVFFFIEVFMAIWSLND